MNKEIKEEFENRFSIDLSDKKLRGVRLNPWQLWDWIDQAITQAVEQAYEEGYVDAFIDMSETFIDMSKKAERKKLGRCITLTHQFLSRYIVTRRKIK